MISSINFGNGGTGGWWTYVLLAVVLFITYHLAVAVGRHFAIRKLGGGRAYLLANNPVSGTYRIVRMMSKFAQNKTAELNDEIYNSLPPESRNVYEFQFFPGSRTIETREPAHIKAILATDFYSFGKGPNFHRMWYPFLGDSIFATDGKLWHNSRSLIRPMFMTDRVSDLIIFERQIEKMMKYIPPSGQTVEMMDLFFRMTMDVTTDFLLGESANSLDNPNSEFTHAFNDVLVRQIRILMLRLFSPFNKLFSKKEYYRDIKIIDQFIMPYIKQTLAIPPDELEKLTKSDVEFTFLHNLARFTRDPKVIRDQLIAVLLAGRDTTAGTLSWVFYELAAYPEKVDRLRAEILEFVGESGTPTYETLKNMKYLRYILQETLRIHPAVPSKIKEALADTVLPGAPGTPSISVLKGDTVCYSPMTLHGRRDLYPPVSEQFADPSLFSPERWYVWQPRPWEYIPFNGGPRICPGQNFAMTEMAYCLVKIFQKYERIEYRGDWHGQQDTRAIISRPTFGVPVAFYEAKKE
ncbi:cytochrome P450 monooxygenase CYP539B5 [Xylaria bambusicola]|uniref:cytochrome P450 monooxygenase CYP539B5 n=1 Tax=Xylaria bambusicola TaxID=326684 RepID=UPI0020086711|nr:cytochrome P450 monooxygenase CYP539B5 [Xylaria bambusicola]KAI0518387.1 cytochrome P450 monooxygenase CYP539B5 [Xylaria bambusicola]